VKRQSTFAVVLAVFLASAACGRFRPTPIREIVRNPAAFEGQTVRISGTVVDATNLLVVKYYHVEDSSGRIAVVARKAVPLRGSQVTVTGKVHQAFVIGDESLTVIVEDS
jgi:starvation-inducible outer membrane lipoprotein